MLYELVWQEIASQYMCCLPYSTLAEATLHMEYLLSEGITFVYIKVEELN